MCKSIQHFHCSSVSEKLHKVETFLGIGNNQVPIFSSPGPGEMTHDSDVSMAISYLFAGDVSAVSATLMTLEFGKLTARSYVEFLERIHIVVASVHLRISNQYHALSRSF
jgi:hypothetical protein